MKRADIEERIKKIKVIVTDVDGVLTDGKIYYDREGHELKTFNILDGSGMVYAHLSGLKTVMISGNFSHAVDKRAKMTRVDALYQNVHNKSEVLDEVLSRFQVLEEEVCFVGDDLVDVSVMSRVGFPVAVPDAAEEVKEKACYITAKGGGQGAVRELIEFILKVQDKWEGVLRQYY